MYNLGISLFSFMLVTSLLTHLAGISFFYASIAGLVVFSLVYFLLARYVIKKIGVLMEAAQRELQAGRAERAVHTLEGGFKYAPWQFYIKGQLNSQIGTVLYLKRDFAAAFEYLQKGFVRHWAGMGMLGICYMKRNKTGKMIETFDKAVSANKKESLLWSLYAYCLDNIGERDRAVAVLEKGIKKTGGDERLQVNLDALKEGRKMKMRAYGDVWYQFHLEKPGAIIKQQTKAIQGRRKIVRR
jgi:tetratricopeptide (TPR) repeat protein